MSNKYTINVNLNLTPAQLVLMDALLREQYVKLRSENQGSAREALTLSSIYDLRNQLPQFVITLIKKEFHVNADVLASALFQPVSPSSALCSLKESAKGMLDNSERRLNDTDPTVK